MSGTDYGAVIRGWWGTHLADRQADRQAGAARALAARLRRADRVEALFEPAVQELAAALGSRDADRIFGLVRVLAELRGTDQASLPRLLGQGDPKTLSPSRFQALMRADGDDLTLRLVRAIRALGPAEGRRCAIAALGRDLWFWNDQTRARWAFEYFGASVPAALHPHSEETSA